MIYTFINLFLSTNIGEETDPANINYLEKLIPNLWVFLIQLCAFLILMFVAIKFGYKPVKNFLNKRKEYITNNLEEARVKNEEATKNFEESNKSLMASKKEAIKIVQDAKIEATKEKNAILDSTQAEIAAKQAKAIEDLNVEKQKAIIEVHDEVVNLAIETTKSILDREVKVSDDDKLINDLVDNLLEKK